MKDDLVTVGEFRVRSEAEIARARLEDAGVQAMVIADDEGGLSPGFFTTFHVRVVVRGDEAAIARAVLGEPG